MAKENVIMDQVQTSMKVALTSMPFFPSTYPSIQLGILKSVLEKNNYYVDDLYLNLDFGKLLSFDLYENFSNLMMTFVGEWAFADLIFERNSDESVFLETIKNQVQTLVPAYKNWDKFLQDVTLLKREARRWLDQTADEHYWKEYELVGFSCTFSQTIPSLALARRLKSKDPQMKIIFGGSVFNSTCAKELSKRIDYVDSFVVGEGEKSIIEIVKSIDAGKDIPKLYFSPSQTELDQIPTPNYDTFFSYIRQSPAFNDIQQEGKITIPIETSRGCWWGEKKRCKFCGLTGSQISYREKSYDKVIDDISRLSEAYKSYLFSGVDCILSQNYYKNLLPYLASKATSYKFFFEIKLTTNPDKIQLLQKAGFTSLQPGIETLDSDLLKLMNKGCTATQNIYFLKMAKFFNINVAWNLLLGIPGERLKSYENIISLIPKIVHLQPPASVHKIRFDRFSPYFNLANEKKLFSQDKTPVTVEPIEQYYYCFPKDWDIRDVAYFFTNNYRGEVSNDVFQALTSLINTWSNLWSNSNKNDRPTLKFKKGISFGHVIDTRFENRNTLEIRNNHYLIAKALEKRSLTMHELVDETGGPFIDLGCASGRVIRFALEKNFNAIGIDVKHTMIEKAKSLLFPLYHNKLQLICDDFLNFNFPGEAGVISLWTNTLPMILEKEKQIDIFNGVRKKLKKNGIFLLWIANDSNLTGARPPREVEVDKGIISINSRVLEDRQLMQRTFIYDFKLNDQKQHFEAVTRIIPKEELVHDLNKCGFTIKEMYGNLDLTPYCKDSIFQIYILEAL
ncbi:MAG: RiPP maturation radical SAM C-methyltransferase [Bacteriovoracaceae bacterium]|nr:RiPP maturation radical SAM C-methyltransferase [Bacteriovoracaceae bacterium]